MSPFPARILWILAVAVPASVVLYAVGAALADKSRLLQRIGDAMLRQKDRALATWPLRHYPGLLEADRLGAASALLAALIAAKSLASLVLGPLAVIWLPPACMTIPPLGRAFARQKERSGRPWRAWMANQTALQLAGHLAAAAVGTSAWWGTWRGEGPPWTVAMTCPTATAGLLAASLALALVAGWYEASGHRRYALL